MSATKLCNLQTQGHLLFEQIDALSKGLKENTSLRTLDLSRRQLDNLSALSEGFRKNSSLHSLRFRLLGLRDKDSSLILDALKDHPTLKSLDLSFNQCHHMNHVAEFIIKQTNLIELQLAYQCVWQAPKTDIRALAQALKQNNTIRTLSLARNKLYDDDAFLIAEALVGNTSLQYLNLRENQIMAMEWSHFHLLFGRLSNSAKLT